MDPNIRDTLKPRRGRSHRPSAAFIQRRIAKIAGKFNLDTQRVRFELILELKPLAEMAQQKGIDTLQPETKQNWMRLAAYISQVINSISKTYDEANIDAELKELRKKVAELTETKKDNSAQQK